MFEIKYMIHCLQAKGIIVDCCWVPSHCGLFGNRQNGKRRCLRKHPLSCWYPPVHMINIILKKRMKTDLNLSNYSYLKGPRPLFSLIYRLRVNALETKHCKYRSCTCRDKWSTNHIVFNCHQLQLLWETQTYFQSILFCVPMYCWRVHLFELYIYIWVYIHEMYVSAYIHVRVHVYRNNCRAINYIKIMSDVTV